MTVAPLVETEHTGQRGEIARLLTRLAMLGLAVAAGVLLLASRSLSANDYFAVIGDSSWRGRWRRKRLFARVIQRVGR